MLQGESTIETPWSGHLVTVQPRIRLLRSFDERHHSYLGYVLGIDGACGDESGEFLIAIGKGTQTKHQFCAGMEASGMSVLVVDPRLELAGLYRTSRIKIEHGSRGSPPEGPPFLGVPPELETYRNRGHRRLSARTYSAKCTSCIWGCKMPVEMVIDHWNPDRKRYRFETFCYGPKNCPLYKAGPTRNVPGRKGMTYKEEDWVDEDATSHRGPDD